MEVPKNTAELLTSLFQQGFIDDQFIQLHQLQDESNPDFLVEVVGLYFEDSERLINELMKALSQDPVDFKAVDACVHQLKGSSASLGVLRMKNCCVAFRSFCDLGDLQGCWQAFQQLKQEYSVSKHKLEELLNGSTLSCQFDPWTLSSQQKEHPVTMDTAETMTI